MLFALAEFRPYDWWLIVCERRWRDRPETLAKMRFFVPPSTEITNLLAEINKYTSS